MNIQNDTHIMLTSKEILDVLYGKESELYGFPVEAIKTVNPGYNIRIRKNKQTIHANWGVFGLTEYQVTQVLSELFPDFDIICARYKTYIFDGCHDVYHNYIDAWLAYHDGSSFLLYDDDIPSSTVQKLGLDINSELFIELENGELVVEEETVRNAILHQFPENKQTDINSGFFCLKTWDDEGKFLPREDLVSLSKTKSVFIDIDSDIHERKLLMTAAESYYEEEAEKRAVADYNCPKMSQKQFERLMKQMKVHNDYTKLVKQAEKIFKSEINI